MLGARMAWGPCQQGLGRLFWRLQRNFKPGLFQHVLCRYPIDPRGLHRHRPDSTFLQPLRHPLQIPGPGAEFLHRFHIPAGWHRHEMTLIADINSRRIAMHDLQARIVLGQPLRQVLSVACDSTSRGANAGRWIFCVPPWHTLFAFEFARLGSVGDHFTVSPAGSSLAFCRTTRHQAMDRRNRDQAL